MGIGAADRDLRCARDQESAKQYGDPLRAALPPVRDAATERLLVAADMLLFS